MDLRRDSSVESEGPFLQPQDCLGTTGSCSLEGISSEEGTY